MLTVESLETKSLTTLKKKDFSDLSKSMFKKWILAQWKIYDFWYNFSFYCILFLLLHMGFLLKLLIFKNYFQFFLIN